MQAQALAAVPRVALTRDEAAASLGVSRSHFERHVQPHLRLIRTGSVRLVPVRELERWADSAATLAGAAHNVQRPGRPPGRREALSLVGRTEAAEM